jgi:hypothetical protein
MAPFFSFPAHSSAGERGGKGRRFVMKRKPSYLCYLLGVLALSDPFP